MIGHCPAPHPDELLYSIIARLSERLPGLNSRGLGVEIFTRTSATAISDLPHRLAALVQVIPPEFGITVQKLIDQNTLWPYWAAFHSEERRLRTRQEMEDGGHAYLSLGLMPSTLPWPKFFRYCASCVDMDRNTVGEAYWHRLHQIPGLDMCARHNERLRNSKVAFRQARNPYEYHSLEASGVLNQPPQVSPCRLGESARQAEFRLANSAAWLLDHPTATRSGMALRERLLWELASRGLATWSGRLRVSNLQSSLREHFPSDWLERIGCRLSSRPHETWVERLFRKPQSTQATIRYLLLVDLLGMSVESILCSQNPSPFGPPPWPCLNRIGGHFHRLTITTCDIHSTRNGTALSGRFKCSDCGMVYVRLGPDTAAEDRERRDWVPVYGDKWDQEMIHLWNDSSVSFRELSRRLGVDPRTAQLQAQRLHLSATRSGTLSEECRSNRQPVQQGPKGSIHLYQLQWLDLRRNNPHSSRTELRKKSPKLYAFLRRHSLEWLESHSPPRGIPKMVGARSDWPARDVALSREVIDAAERLLKRAPLVRLTKTAILREAGRIWAVDKLGRLPRTQTALKQREEDRMRFAIRRIRHVRMDASRGGERIPDWKLIRRANLRADLLPVDAIQDAISQAHTIGPKLRIPTKY